MKKQDFDKILENYNLGKFKKTKQITREDTGAQDCFIITTSKGKYFLKTYWKDFKCIKRGLELLHFLEKKNYPSIKIIQTKKKNNYLLYKKKPMAIFEFISIKHTKRPTIQAYEFGKTLGRLHKLTKSSRFRSTKGPEFYLRLFNKSKNHHKNPPKLLKELKIYAEKFLKDFKIPKNQPKALCHEEFTTEHVKFKGNKVYKVIDWDEINRGFMLFDLGMTLTIGIRNKKLLKSILKGYESQRKLTEWEKSHLYEAIMSGMLRYFVWGLDEPLRWYYIAHLKRIKYLKELGKEKFQKSIQF
ncbi:phosphotransferase [Nanoarchaeota archaeon]